MTDVSTNSRFYKTKRNTGTVLTNIARYIFLLAYGYVLIYPILYMISKSFMAPIDYNDPTVQWIPKNFSIVHYKFAVFANDYWNGLKSTLANMIIPGIIEIFSCMVAAYGLSRFNFKGKKILTVFMILTILIPTTMIIIPSYVNMRWLDIFGIFGLLNKVTKIDLRLNLLGTPLVFYLPSLLGVGLHGGLFIFIYTQFFKGLPKELEEAAWIDGAGTLKTFLRIVVPSSTVPIVTVSIFSVIWHWNEYYMPQIYMGENFPLSVTLYNIEALAVVPLQGEYYSMPILIITSCLLFILPMLIFYILLQRKFIASIANSGIVG